LLGFSAGILSGLIGVGGGIILVPVLTIIFKFDQRMSQGTTLLAIIPIALAASIQYYVAGCLNLNYALWISAGSMIGIYLGSYLAHQIPPKTLTRIFGIFMIFVGFKMFVN
jgi:uncharacterized membrane protein YfcA